LFGALASIAVSVIGPSQQGVLPRWGPDETVLASKEEKIENKAESDESEETDRYSHG
jgi:hypothetical protein